MANLYVLIRLPGSGKSTLAHKVFSDCVIMESDALRQELFGDAADQQNPELVFSLLNQRTADALAAGKNVCYDATNYLKAYRKSMLDIVPENVRRIAVFLDVDPSVCRKRNAQWERVVLDSVIESMDQALEVPDDSENWDEIFYIISLDP